MSRDSDRPLTPRDELRATIAAVRSDTQALEALEDRKADAQPGSDDQVRLAERASDLGERIRIETRAERDIAAELRAARRAAN